MDSQPPIIPIWRTVASGYRLGIGALLGDGALFRYFVYASLLSLPILGLQLYHINARLASAMEVQTPGAMLQSIALAIALYVGYAAASSPYGVAVHRKVLLGEAPRGYYATAIFQRTQLRFALTSLAVYALFFVAPFFGNLAIYLLYGVNPFDGPAVALVLRQHRSMALVVALMTWLSLGTAVFLAARLSFAFPATAIDAAGASLRQSIKETRGSTWRLFFVFLLIFALPFALFIIAIVVATVIMLVNHPELAGSPERMKSAIFTSPPFFVICAIMYVFAMALIAVTAAAAARAYETRVGRGLAAVAEVFS